MPRLAESLLAPRGKSSVEKARLCGSGWTILCAPTRDGAVSAIYLRWSARGSCADRPARDHANDKREKKPATKRQGSSQETKGRRLLDATNRQIRTTDARRGRWCRSVGAGEGVWGIVGGGRGVVGGWERGGSVGGREEGGGKDADFGWKGLLGEWEVVGKGGKGIGNGRWRSGGER